jgi:response regulator of citrate/malate metabolism
MSDKNGDMVMVPRDLIEKILAEAQLLDEVRELAAIELRQVGIDLDQAEVEARAKVEALAEELEKGLATRQKAAVVTWLLAQGEALTSADVAELCDFSIQSARELLRQLEEVLPIERQPSGAWVVTEPVED